VFKDATLFFSRGAGKENHDESRKVPNLATVIPAMDHIDSVLTTNAIDNCYCLAVQAALTIGKKTLNHYYSKSDLSHNYQIAMGKVTSFYSYTVPFAKLNLLTVHPRHKLEYFRKAFWPKDWIEVAKRIVRDEYEHTYKIIDGDLEVEGAATVNVPFCLIPIVPDCHSRLPCPPPGISSTTSNAFQLPGHKTFATNSTSILAQIQSMSSTLSNGGSTGGRSIHTYQGWR
jgi:hypothetical protein